MKFLLALASLALASCDSTDLANFSAGYARGYAAYQAPVYCPPPPIQHFSTWTPNSPQPFRYYNVGPAGGSAFTPGVTNALHPFTYFNP